MTVFVDTGYFIARMQARDQWHRAAVEADDPALDLVTSNEVINETITLLQMRGFLSLALDFLREIRARVGRSGHRRIRPTEASFG